MKKVSYKEYKKEMNKKKKIQKAKNIKTNTSLKKESVNNVKKKNTSENKNTELTATANIKSTTNKSNLNTNKKKEEELNNTSKNNEIKFLNDKELDEIIKLYEKDIKKDIQSKKKDINSTDHSEEKNSNIKSNKNIKVNSYTCNKKIEIIDICNVKEDSEIKILNDNELIEKNKTLEKDIPKKRKKRRRVRWNNVTLLGFILIFLTILIISSTEIIEWIKDSNSSEKEITDIQENTEVIETENNEQTEIIENTEEEIPKTSPYWTYIEMNLIDVNFDNLKQKNSDTAGWIQVNGTNINYPYVQTSDNEYYLTHSFEKKNNSSGWVFMDYRNNKYDFDKNTIIYAHGRMNNTMFGTLRKILKNGWLNNTNNHVIKLSTDSENTLWQVFSVYRIPTTNDYIQVNFINDIEFINFGNMLIGRSTYNFNTSISAEDKILTLSTCYDDNDKIVLHAKLIKREKK